MKYLSFCAWLISFSIMTSNSIYVVTNESDFIFFYGWTAFYYAYIPHFCYPFIS
jgi:hypothetical protein